MEEFKEDKELYIKRKVEIVGKFEDKPIYPHVSNKLPKSIRDAVKEKLDKELKRFDALNSI